MSDKIEIGTRVKVAHKPEHDHEYGRGGVPARRANDGREGKVIGRSDAHGLCFEVDTQSGCCAWYEPDELTPFDEVSHTGARMGIPTPRYSALREYVEVSQLDVLMVDNASDAYDASESDRARVRAFMRSMARIAQERAGAVRLLVHVVKGTSRGDRTGTERY